MLRIASQAEWFFQIQWFAPAKLPAREGVDNGEAVFLKTFSSLVIVWAWAAVAWGQTTAIEATATEPAPLRIVSFSPALSQFVVDLGRGDWIVGVADHDTAAPEGLPVVGNYLAPHVERLLSLRPTHVLAMVGKEGPDARLVEWAARGQFELLLYPTPHSVREILDMLAGVDAGRTNLGRALRAQDRARELSRLITYRLSAISQAVEDAAAIPPRVLLVFNPNPLWASGPGSVEDDLLCNYLHASNAAGDLGGVAVVLDRERLLELRPDVVLFMLPGAPPIDDFAQDPRPSLFRGLDVPAVEQNRFEVIGDPRVLLIQSTAVDQIAARLAMAIHPDKAGAIRKIMQSNPPPSEVSSAPPADVPLPATKPSEAPETMPSIPMTTPVHGSDPWGGAVEQGHVDGQ